MVLYCPWNCCLLENGNLIATVFRDSNTLAKHGEKREIARRAYGISGNTALEVVISDLKPYFLSNDLRALANCRNENPEWMQYYNATLVVPIRSFDQTQGFVYYGIIAIDSPNQSGFDLFDNDECVKILEKSAAKISPFFVSLSLQNLTV